MTREENYLELKALKEERQIRIENGLKPEELDFLEEKKENHDDLYRMIKLSNMKYKLDVTGQIPEETDRPIIIAPNHVRKQDIEIMMQAFPKHMFLLSGDHENVHGTLSGSMLEKNGIIYFDMEDKKDRNNVKYVIRDVLDAHANLLWYYEGSWDISENKPYYDGNYHIVQAAIDSNALVLPVAFDLIGEKKLFNRRIACVNFGNPIDYRKKYGNRSLSATEKINALDELKGEIGARLFEIWDKYSNIKRDSLVDKYRLDAKDYFVPDYKRRSPLSGYWQEYKKNVLDEWKFNEKDIAEKHFVDDSIVDQKDAFEHLDNIKFNKKTAFLFLKKNHH